MNMMVVVVMMMTMVMRIKVAVGFWVQNSSIFVVVKNRWGNLEPSQFSDFAIVSSYKYLHIG
jgi:hypothetical protein